MGKRLHIQAHRTSSAWTCLPSFASCSLLSHLAVSLLCKVPVEFCLLFSVWTRRVVLVTSLSGPLLRRQLRGNVVISCLLFFRSLKIQQGKQYIQSIIGQKLFWYSIGNSRLTWTISQYVLVFQTNWLNHLFGNDNDVYRLYNNIFSSIVSIYLPIWLICTKHYMLSAHATQGQTF